MVIAGKEKKTVLPGTELLISSDSHVTEDGDLWFDRLPASMKDRAPRFPKPTPEELARFHPGGWDPHERLKEMDEDGVSAEVFYPGFGLRMFHIKDAELQRECFRVYNDWLADFCSIDKNRLIGVPMVSVYDVDLAIKEMQRTANLGMKGALIWEVPPPEIPFSSDHYEKFWAAAQEMGVPVNLHILTGFSYNSLPSTQRTGPEHYRQCVITKTTDSANVLFDLIFYGVLDRYPQLKVVFVEPEIGWIPFVLQQLDIYFNRFHKNDPIGIDLQPSEYFKRQVYATFVNDFTGTQSLRHWGEDNCMWSSDYPHPVTFWPNSRDLIARHLEHLSPEARRKLVAGNVIRVYGLEEHGKT